jgi:hypothetical protein
MAIQVAAKFVRDQIPANSLFAGLGWKISLAPFPLRAILAKELDSLDRVLLQFYRSVRWVWRN